VGLINDRYGAWVEGAVHVLLLGKDILFEPQVAFGTTVCLILSYLFDLILGPNGLSRIMLGPPSGSPPLPPFERKGEDATAPQ
jgi:hypothetical protein